MPRIDGYTPWLEGSSTQATGVAIYYRNVLKAKRLDSQGDRLLAGTIGNLLVILGYAPSESAKRENKEAFYMDLVAFIRRNHEKCPNHEIVLAGDFDAQIAGQGHTTSN